MSSTPSRRRRRQDDDRPALLYVTTVASTAKGFLQPYADALRVRGWRVEVATNVGSMQSELVDKFDGVHDVSTSRSLKDAAGLPGALRDLRRVIGSGFDIVHVHTPIAAFVTRLAVGSIPRSRRPKVVYTAHGFHFHHAGNVVANAVFVLAERLAGRWTDALVVINEEDHAAARRYRIVPEARLRYMPGIGVDTDHYALRHVQKEAVSALRRQLNIPADVPVVVFVGDLNRNKRPGDLVAAAAILRDPRIHLLFIGDGPARASTADLASRLGLAERVRFVGLVEDVRPYLALATALVLPSRREGLARSVMEALALEVPVIGSTARGNAELIGADGVVYPTGDLSRLADALRRILTSPEEAAAMGQRGRRRMVERYDLSKLVAQHLALYEGMLGR